MQHTFLPSDPTKGAFYGNPDLKQQALQRLANWPAEHYIANGWSEESSFLGVVYRRRYCMFALMAGKGHRSPREVLCAFGVLERIRQIYGLPRAFSELVYKVYDRQPQHERKAFALDIIGATPVGMPLEPFVRSLNARYGAYISERALRSALTDPSAKILAELKGVMLEDDIAHVVTTRCGHTQNSIAHVMN